MLNEDKALLIFLLVVVVTLAVSVIISTVSLKQLNDAKIEQIQRSDCTCVEVLE